MLGSVEETNIPPISSITSISQTDRSILSRIVGNILTEKPHLRPEDQQVLKFLAEKEGAAFESEIRSKFQIPKTTIWRLVKRLEREELVEIRKAGGQNLIKLRFEDKQA
jgi:DNA-binding MarR family transcriptional regulator